MQENEQKRVWEEPEAPSFSDTYSKCVLFLFGFIAIQVFALGYLIEHRLDVGYAPASLAEVVAIFGVVLLLARMLWIAGDISLLPWGSSRFESVLLGKHPSFNTSRRDLAFSVIAFLSIGISCLFGCVVGPCPAQASSCVVTGIALGLLTFNPENMQSMPKREFLLFFLAVASGTMMNMAVCATCEARPILYAPFPLDAPIPRALNSQFVAG